VFERSWCWTDRYIRLISSALNLLCPHLSVSFVKRSCSQHLYRSPTVQLSTHNLCILPVKDSWAVALCWTSPALHSVLNTVMSVWRASSALGVKLIWGTAALHKLSTAAPHNSCQSPALVRTTTSGQILQLLVTNNVFFFLWISGRGSNRLVGSGGDSLCREAGGVWWLLTGRRRMRSK